MSQHRGSIIDVSTERKVFVGIGLVTLFILAGGVWLMNRMGQKEQEKLNTPRMGEEVASQGGPHIKQGESHPDYNSNPPTSGWMYDGVAGAGIHESEVADELVVHSMEHGAAVVWYQPGLPGSQIDDIKKAFNSASGAKIMLPRKNLDVPVALTSWGRILKLSVINDASITEFINTNAGRAPESAPI